MTSSAQSEPSTRLPGGLPCVSEATTRHGAASPCRQFLTAVSTSVLSHFEKFCLCLLPALHITLLDCSSVSKHAEIVSMTEGHCNQRPHSGKLLRCSDLSDIHVLQPTLCSCLVEPDCNLEKMNSSSSAVPRHPYLFFCIEFIK